MPTEAKSISPEDGITLLKKQLEKASDLLSACWVSWNQLKTWESTTLVCIEKAFGKDHRNVKEFLAKMRAFKLWSSWFRGNHTILKWCIAEVERYIEQLEMELHIQESIVSTPVLPASVIPELSKRIFIVHGHDSELKQATARLVMQLGLEPVILHEQSNRGQTIIEKLSTHAQESGFAIVLLTADDIGGAKGTEHSLLQTRARQNVIFEMGLFFGLLGRGRVCAVYESGIEIPSDLSGVMYVKYDSGQWRYEVAKEIQGAGHAVDLNKIL